MSGLSGKGEDAAMEERESSHILSLITTSDPLVVFWGLEHSGVRKQGGWLPICGGWIRGIKNPSGTRY